jgi:tRNA(fMet)-specific endonuclease VapC
MLDTNAVLEKSGQPLASMDLLIASHAFADGCTLVTADSAFARFA